MFRHLLMKPQQPRCLLRPLRLGLVNCQCQRTFPRWPVRNKDGLAMVLLGECPYRRDCVDPNHPFPQSSHSNNSVLGRYQSYRLAGMPHSGWRHRAVVTWHRIRRSNISVGVWPCHHLDHRWNCYMDHLFPRRGQGRKVSSRPRPAVQKYLESLHPCDRLLSRVRFHRRILLLACLLSGSLGRQCFALWRLPFPVRPVVVVHLRRNWLHHQEDGSISTSHHWRYDVSDSWICVVH